MEILSPWLQHQLSFATPLFVRNKERSSQILSYLVKPPPLLEPPEDSGPCRSPQVLPSVLTGAAAALLRLPLLVYLVEDGQSGGTQLRTGPRPTQLPSARTTVAQLEPGRRTVACRDTGQ